MSHFPSNKMTSMDVLAIIESIEGNMVRDYLISSDFHSIQNGKLNVRRRGFMILINILNVFFMLRPFFFFLADKDSMVHFYGLNPFHAYGRFRRLMEGAFVLATAGITSQAVTIVINEGRAKLTLITDLKEMFHRLKNPSSSEVKHFTLFLKLMVYAREFGFFATWIPLVLFRVAGAIITAYNYNSIAFIIAYIPIFLVYTLVQQYCGQIYVYHHLIIAQSTMYFKLRLNRIRLSLQKIMINSRRKPGKSNGNIRMARRISRIMPELKGILDEVLQHNHVIKYWLRGELNLWGGVLILFFVFIMSDIHWYYKVFPSFLVLVIVALTSIQFSQAGDLFVVIRSMSGMLHSCQTVLQDQHRDQTIRSQYLERETLDSVVFFKTKFQIMRMIHRVSSKNLRISFTNGDVDSFSPASAGRFVESVVIIFLIFMNAGASSITDFMFL